MLAADSPFRRNDDLLTSPSRADLVMLDAEAGAYYGLDPVGRRIWELAEKPTTAHDLCGQLVQDYDIDATTCLDQVRPFLQSLLDKGLLVRC